MTQDLFSTNKVNKLRFSLLLPWQGLLAEYYKTSKFQSLVDDLRREYLSKTIYPTAINVFKAFELTPFDSVKVVILGQDPYHGQGQAQGLSFSVPTGMRLPPSLQNIYKEIEAEFGIQKDFTNGDLSHWAEQGVLLLNSVLTVQANKPASHQKIGWEEFTDLVISRLSEKRSGLVFILWGNFAKSKASLIDQNKHLILQSPHPSPFSARRGFFGNGHFSQCNQYLESHNIKAIQW
jgi:uracil-DNA glycosylase